jgi:integrase
MSINQTPDGRYYVSWREPGKTHPSKRYFGRGELARAQAARFDEEKKRDKGKLRPTSLTVAALCQIYHNDHPVQETTSINDQYKFHILTSRLGLLPAEMLSYKELDAYVAWRLKEGRKRSTIAREIRLLKAVYSWAEDHDPILIARNPIHKYKLRGGDHRDIPVPPSPDEIAAIIAHAEPHLARAILLCWSTGIRPGPREAYAVRWSDVNSYAGNIRIMGSRKGGPAIRCVPIGKELLGCLAAWKKEDAEKHPAKDLTLIHYRGLRIRSLKHAWKSAKMKAGIVRRLRLYDLRHAMVSSVLAGGADLKAVSEVVGHSRPDTTLRQYQHVTRKQHREVIDLIPAIAIESRGTLGNKTKKDGPKNEPQGRSSAHQKPSQG